VGRCLIERGVGESSFDSGNSGLHAGYPVGNRVPLLLQLADRLGFAIWEEIPLYHYTPLTYGIAMDRGIPQQMLREMALRDMNRPSVLFHGLSNESTGTDEREDALSILHEIDREIERETDSPPRSGNGDVHHENRPPPRAP